MVFSEAMSAGSEVFDSRDSGRCGEGMEMSTETCRRSAGKPGSEAGGGDGEEIKGRRGKCEDGVFVRLFDTTGLKQEGPGDNEVAESGIIRSHPSSSPASFSL